MNTSPFRMKRVGRGWSQGDLADQVQSQFGIRINRARISMFENGVLKLREDELQALRKILKSDFTNPDF